MPLMRLAVAGVVFMCTSASDAAPSGVLVIGYGITGMSRLGAEAPSTGSQKTLQFGQSVFDRLDAMLEITLSERDYTSTVTTQQEDALIILGIRYRLLAAARHNLYPAWGSPFSALDLADVYAKIGIAANIRSRQTATDRQDIVVPAAKGALGYLPLQGAEFGVGGEIQWQIAKYDEGIQRCWALVFIVEVGRP